MGDVGNLNDTLMDLEEGDGVRIVVSDDPIPDVPWAEPHAVSFTGIVDEITTSGSEDNRFVKVIVTADQVPESKDDWRDVVRIVSGSEDGEWRRPGVGIATETSPTDEADGSEPSAGPGWTGIGLLGELEVITTDE